MAAEERLVSIVIPVFNESMTIQQVIDKVRSSLAGYSFEIIAVDDGSSDGTTDLLKRLPVRASCHTENQGKGAAIRTALQLVTGQIVVIQDADLEYDPADIPKLIQPILDGYADVVFGSRFHGATQRVHLYWHRVANGWLTWLTNLLFDLDLSDMETGYKAFRRTVLDGIVIRENGFGIEPELTAKFAKQNRRIYEVPISYYGRDYSQGKKIGFRDAIWAAWCIIRYRLSG